MTCEEEWNRLFSDIISQSNLSEKETKIEINAILNQELILFPNDKRLLELLAFSEKQTV